MQLGWWLGHGFELLGIALVGIPVAIDLSRAQPSRSLTGGPRAGELVQAEQAFLGARVRALTPGSPRRTRTPRVTRAASPCGPCSSARSLGFRRTVRSLATGGLLHDIGKLSVPDEILRSRGPSTRTSSQSSSGTPSGATSLGELGGFSDLVRRLVLDHHERLDGAGYRTAARHSTSTWRRASSPSATCTTRSSPSASTAMRTHDKAIGLLREQTGSAFDPAASQPSSACSHETHLRPRRGRSRRLVLRLRASRRVRERDAEAFRPAGDPSASATPTSTRSTRGSGTSTRCASKPAARSTPVRSPRTQSPAHGRRPRAPLRRRARRRGRRHVAPSHALAGNPTELVTWPTGVAAIAPPPGPGRRGQSRGPQGLPRGDRAQRALGRGRGDREHAPRRERPLERRLAPRATSPCARAGTVVSATDLYSDGRTAQIEDVATCPTAARAWPAPSSCGPSRRHWPRASIRLPDRQ